MTELNIIAVTDTGRTRTNNEDSIATDPNIGLVVLADGMGGHLAGEVASGLAVEIITRHLQDKAERGMNAPDLNGAPSSEAYYIQQAIELANQTIHETAQSKAECAGMGSTVVVAMFHGDKISIGHVGDSRLYRLRNGELRQITQDHSVVQELLSRGLITEEDAKNAFNKNLVTRALGVEATVKADIDEQEFQEGDVYLLCSDGLNDVLRDDEILSHFKIGQGNLENTVRDMISDVNARGGPDNVSIILVRTGTRFDR